MKRQRGRGRKPGNPGNRSFESNGPDVKIRGTASQIYEKYLQLARDASSAGDRVRAEALYQHAEHYFRLVQANQPPKREPREGEEAGDQNRAEGADGSDPLEVVTPEGGDMSAPEGEDGEDKQPRRRTRRSRRSRGDNAERGDGQAQASGDAEAALEAASAAADGESGGDSSESEAA